MGDRANIIVKQEGGEPPVVIYSHWGGTTLHNGGIEQAMEAAASRIADPHYYTALLVSALFDEALVSGIGTGLDDNEHPVIVIDSMTGKREKDMGENEASAFLKKYRWAE